MTDLIVGGVSIAVLLGVVYWVQKSFVSKDTCKAHGECVEGALQSLEKLMNEKFKNIEKLLGNLIKKHG